MRLFMGSFLATCHPEDGREQSIVTQRSHQALCPAESHARPHFERPHRVACKHLAASASRPTTEASIIVDGRLDETGNGERVLLIPKHTSFAHASCTEISGGLHPSIATSMSRPRTPALGPPATGALNPLQSRRARCLHRKCLGRPGCWPRGHPERVLDGLSGCATTLRHVSLHQLLDRPGQLLGVFMPCLSHGPRSGSTPGVNGSLGSVSV